MAREVIDQYGGITTYLESHLNEIAIREVEDASAVLERCAIERSNRNSVGGPNHGAMAASIPPVVFGQWEKEFREEYCQDWTWRTFITMKLNARENSKFKIYEGRI